MGKSSSSKVSNASNTKNNNSKTTNESTLDKKSQPGSTSQGVKGKSSDNSQEQQSSKQKSAVNPKPSMSLSASSSATSTPKNGTSPIIGGSPGLIDGISSAYPTREVLLNVESYFSSKTWKILVQKAGQVKKEIMTLSPPASPKAPMKTSNTANASEKQLSLKLLQILQPMIKKTNSIQSLNAWWSRPVLQVVSPELHLVGLGKSSDAAEQLKEIGNLEYRKGNNESALENWSAALRFISIDDHNRSSSSKVMANVYANRSLILADRGSPDLALMDIRRAFQHGYPRENWGKILRRKALCLKALGVTNFFENAETVLYEALEWCRFYENEGMERAVMRDIERLKVDSQTNRGDEEEECIRFPQKGDLPSYISPHIRIVNTGYGRGLVAMRDIAAGELLLLEHPFAWAVRRPYRSSYCSGCMIPLMNATGIYCHICSINEPFCSETCRARMHDVHKFECRRRWPLEIDDELRLALRVLFLIKTGKYTCEFDKKDLPHAAGKDTAGCDDNGVYKADLSAFEFLTSNLEKHSPTDLARYATQVTLVGDYLGLNSEDQAHLIRILARIRCNAATISSLQQNHYPNGVNADGSDENVTTTTVDETTERIGIGMFFIFSLVNHSCDPNSFVSFPQGGSFLHLRNSRDIKKGEEITISYGPLYRRKSTEVRQQLCKTAYFFDCKCAACTGKLEDYDRYINAFSCASCPFPLREKESVCKGCGTKVDLVLQQKRIDMARSFEQNVVRQSSSADLPARLEQSIRFYEAAYHPKSMELGKVYDHAAEQLCKLASSDQAQLFDTAAKWCEKSVKIVRHIFGDDSIEAAQEHFKLCTILMAGTNIDRAVNAIVQGIQLHSKLYGLSSNEKHQLEKMLHYVKLRQT